MLEVERLDTLKIFLSGVVPINSGVNVHRSIIGVTADVLENVIFHSLIAH